MLGVTILDVTYVPRQKWLDKKYFKFQLGS